MQHVHLLLALIISMNSLSCKREKQPRPAPEDGRASATQPVSPSTAPSGQSTTKEADGTGAEQQLLQFIAVSRELTATAHATGRSVHPSPEGFREFAATARDDEAMQTSIKKAGTSFDEWYSVGNRAWSTWSVVQKDYNAEAPLRENAKQLTDARGKLAVAEASVKSGVREMSPQERANRVAAAHDAIINANDRAELWAQKAADLREQIAAAESISGRLAPDEPPAIAVARADALGGSRAALAAMSQELGVAERNERQARDDARRAEESARHPEQPLNDTEKSDLLRQSRETIEKTQLDIEHFQQTEKLLQARLFDDRRVNADDRRKVAPESDIALLRKHLPGFNAAWGMTVEGRLATDH